LTLQIISFLIIKDSFYYVNGSTPVITNYHGKSSVVPDSVKKTMRFNFKADSLNIEIIDAYYGVQFYQDGIIFMMNTKKVYNKLADYISFGRFDTYYAPLKDHHLGSYEYFSKRFPFPYSPGAITFTGDYRTMYFTKSSPVNNTERKFRIYRTVNINSRNRKKAGWSEEFKVLPFCKKDYSYMHPAVSVDGQFLVFSSDMPASNKGDNLFIVSHSSSGWTNPTYVGPQINSDENELFPFLDSYNNLYFSSNRHMGYGGYDIYVSRYNGTGWDNPVNLGAEINSGYDEMMFKINRKDSTLAFLVSIRDSDIAQARLFKVYLPDSMKLLATNIKVESKPDTSVVIPKKVKTIPAKKPKKEISSIVFRVQIIASMKPKGNFVVTINNKKYITFEYFYKGAYRYTIGEFDSVEKALILKSICRKKGYNQAFVAAFKDNIRVTDPKVFKH